MGRLKRAGSDRSRRSLSGGEESADDGESMGWRTPAHVESPPPDGSQRASSVNLNTVGGHLAVASSRKASSNASSEGEDEVEKGAEETNENVRIHPPSDIRTKEREIGAESPASGSSDKSDPAAKDATLLHRHAEVSKAEPTAAHTLKREDEKPHAAVHNVPEHHFSSAAAASTSGAGSGAAASSALDSGGGTEDKKLTDPVEGGTPPRQSMSSDILAMPGSFDHTNDTSWDSAHHSWASLFQKLGLRR